MNKVNLRRAPLLVEDGIFFRTIRDPGMDGLLAHLARNAADRGMVINEKKTGLICISAATSFDTRVEVVINGQKITGSQSIKVLGLTIDRDYSFKTHTANL